MNHRLTIVSKKSGTAKGLGKNAGYNKGKKVQKGAEAEEQGFGLLFALAEACGVGGRVLFTLHSALLWQNRTRQRSQPGRLPDDQYQWTGLQTTCLHQHAQS